jgi:hypothetical protein
MIDEKTTEAKDPNEGFYRKRHSFPTALPG